MFLEYNKDVNNGISADLHLRVEELLVVSRLLKALNMDSKKIDDLFYYHKKILNDDKNTWLVIPSKYISFRFKNVDKKELVDTCGQLPLFYPEDIF